MFEDFLKKAASALSERHFELISSGSGRTAVFIKDECPVVYIVSVVDFQCLEPESYEKFISTVAKNILDRNRDVINNAVSVNILYSLDRAAENFINSRDNIRQSGVHNVWWMTDGRELYFGKGQPDSVFGIEKCIREAVGDSSPASEKSVSDISREKYAETSLKASGKFPAFTAAIILVNVVIFIIQYFSGNNDEFITRFGINGEMIFSGRQFYRLFTYMFIHSGLEHVLPNMFFLFIYGSRFEGYFGKKYIAFVYFISGLCGGLLSALANDGTFAVGASAAIFGVLGALLVILKKTRQKLAGIDYMTMLIVVIFEIGMGVASTGVDNFGHIGGLAAGMLIGLLGYKKNNIGNNKVY